MKVAESEPINLVAKISGVCLRPKHCKMSSQNVMIEEENGKYFEVRAPRDHGDT